MSESVINRRLSPTSPRWSGSREFTPILAALRRFIASHAITDRLILGPRRRKGAVATLRNRGGALLDWRQRWLFPRWSSPKSRACRSVRCARRGVSESGGRRDGILAKRVCRRCPRRARVCHRHRVSQHFNEASPRPSGQSQTCRPSRASNRAHGRRRGVPAAPGLALRVERLPQPRPASVGRTSVPLAAACGDKQPGAFWPSKHKTSRARFWTTSPPRACS